VVAVAVGAYVLTKRADALPFAGKPAPTDEQKAAAKDVAVAVNDFAFKLAHQLAKERKGGNMLISPLSVATAHSMLLAGTTGDAKKELADVLGYGKLGDASIHGGMFALNYEAQRAENGQFRAGNAFMPLDNSPIKAGFSRILRDNYDAADFRLPGATPESLLQINNWVKVRTDNMIPEIITEFPSQCRFVLLNASAFSARWENEFDPSKTRDDSFTTSAGKQVSVPLMRLGEVEFPAAYDEDGVVTAAELPYKGGAFALVVLLPPANENVWTYLSRFDGRKWSETLAGLRKMELDVVLPRFSFDDSHDLVPLLGALGAKRMFVGGSLLGISDKMPETFVAVDIQKTHIEVDEKGTRAAAATDMVATDAAAMFFDVNRAFIYAIVHKPTGVIVFLGVCGDPTVKR
jgi:serine protease inhibitor